MEIMWNSEKYQWKINWIFNNIEWMKSTKMKSNEWYNLCDYLSDDMNDEINEKQLNIWFFGFYEIQWRHDPKMLWMNRH